MAKKSRNGLIRGGESTNHASGNHIPVIVNETGERFNYEGDEYHICSMATQSNEILEFIDKTNKEILDEIYKLYGCQVREGELHMGDYILCKLVIRDQGRRTRTGTVKEILNMMQVEKNCRVSIRSRTGAIPTIAPLKEISKTSGTPLNSLIIQSLIGIEDEAEEHGGDRNKAYQIALEHLNKNPNYYTILKQVGLLAKGGLVSGWEMPSSEIYHFALNIKNNHPEIWSLGGNIYGNQAFKKLEKIVRRGYWLSSERDFYGKWRSFVARHQHNFRIPGVVANLKWLSFGNLSKHQIEEVISDAVKG